MEPTWEETSEAPAAPDRAPASAPSQAASPTWDDTEAAPPPAPPSWDDTSDLQAQYGTPAQQQTALLEGMGRGAIPFFSSIEKAAGADPTAMRMREEANPGTAALSEFGSFAGTGLLTGGLSAGARGVAEAFTLPGLISKIGRAAEGAVPVGKTAVRLSAEMMALQGGAELTKSVEQDPAQTAQTALINIGLSGAGGLIIGAPLGAASTAWEKLNGPTVQKYLTKIKSDWGMGDPLNKEEEIVSPALKQVLKVFGGVAPETMEQYAAQRDAVMAAPEFPEVYGHALDHILDMQENLEAKKASVAGAQANFKEFLGQQKLALQQAGYDAKTADTIAQQALKEAQTRIGIGLQDGALESAPKAFSAVQKLRTQAMEMSQGARDILDQTPGYLSLKPILESVRPMQDELYSKGFPAMAEDLGKTMDIFATQYGDKISYSDAKSMIQGLQQRGTWNMLANEVAQGTRPYYNQLSGIMNEALKDAVPAYRAAMEPTADAFKLLSKLDKYGSPEAANKAVLALKNTGNYVNEMPMLRDLESKSGIPFTTQLEQYANPSVRDAMTKTLPEYGQALKVAEGLQRLKDPEVKAALEKAPYLSQSYKKLKNAEAMLQQAVERKAGLSGLSPATLEGKLKSVMAGRGLNARRIFENVPGINDMTIPEVLDLINIRQAFEKGAMNGSRNVNLMAKIGGGLGGFIGSTGGAILGGPGGAALGGAGGAAIGGGAGAVFGGILDKDGPALVKRSLDRYLDKYGDLPQKFNTTPRHVKAALFHFLGVGVDPDAKAFKSTVDYLKAHEAGSGYLKKAAEAIFQGAKTIPSHIWSDKDKANKLDEDAKKIKVNEQALLETGGHLARYLPKHGMALAQTVARATKYINDNRPIPQKNAPLDDEMAPPKESLYAFQRGLHIAQQPLTVLQRVGDNTLLPEDVQHLNSMYPELYQHMKSSIMDAMTKHLAGGGKIPYSTRQSLSLFMGEAMDSSLAPQNIMAAQGVFQSQRQATLQSPAPKGKKDTSKLASSSQRYQTVDQSAQARRSQPT